jgi:hypothetical protein
MVEGLTKIVFIDNVAICFILDEAFDAAHIIANDTLMSSALLQIVIESQELCLKVVPSARMVRAHDPIDLVRLPARKKQRVSNYVNVNPPTFICLIPGYA